MMIDGTSWLDAGHFTQDCFHVEGGKAYELVPDIQEMMEMNEGPEEGTSSRKKRKKVNILIEEETCVQTFVNL